ncbi:MAG TPA: DNA translocase FtsK 4TM domain-containing protein, partial [Acidobacteriota bacterium]|nr:DNA translocase FtsK 4TM domain-containing protein [Acidobacteriota bacterium]
MANEHVKREIRGVLFLALSILLLLALFSYDRLDPSFNVSSDRVQVKNYVGPVGAYTADFLILFFGLVSYMIPVILLSVAFSDLTHRQVEALYTKIIGSTVLLLAFSGFMSLAVGTWGVTGELPDGTPAHFPVEAGGWVGTSLQQIMQANVGYAGAILILSTATLLALLLLFRLSLGKMLSLLSSRFVNWFRSLQLGMRKKMDTQMKMRERKKVIQKHIERIEKQSDLGVVPKHKKEKPEKTKEEVRIGIAPTRAPAAKEEEPVQLDFRDMSENFVLPPLTILEAPSNESDIDKKELVEKSKVITAKLLEFQIAGTVTEIHPGPIVTTFEFKPEAGIKYSKIVSMCNDLSMALKAESIRIDRLAGQATIGIEVPNRTRETISLREIIGSQLFQQSTSPLTLGVGKLIHGEVYITDLMKMPHLLIAGSTNSGKSVAINAMLCSILYKATPEEVKFILIDPKRLELKLYEDIPHLMVPVVVEPKLAANALKWAVSEMEERYRLLASFNVRNIMQFNQMFLDESLQANFTDEQRKQLKPL